MYVTSLKHMELMVMMIKKHHMIILALILNIQCADGENGTLRRRNLLVSASPAAPYKGVMIGGGPSTTLVAAVPPPLPYCAYPPPAKPTLPSPLPPAAASPGASPPAGSPSIAPAAGSPAANPPASPGAAPARPPSIAPEVRQPDQGLWCVANPTVASEEVQAAMDYACGSGADCHMVAPGGPCYLPDTLMAHASFAFNSYWQRTKLAGGTCDFAGAAMLITKDPSYDDCQYVYT